MDNRHSLKLWVTSRLCSAWKLAHQKISQTYVIINLFIWSVQYVNVNWCVVWYQHQTHNFHLLPVMWWKLNQPYQPLSSAICPADVFQILSLAGHQPCLNGGGCQKFCFPVPDETKFTRKCECPYGEKLASDGTTCNPNPSVSRLLR